jgi:hypothetical protein
MVACHLHAFATSPPTPCQNAPTSSVTLNAGMRRFSLGIDTRLGTVRFKNAVEHQVENMEDVGEILKGIKATMERIQTLGQRATEIQAKGDELQAKQVALMAEHEAFMIEKSRLESETHDAVAEFTRLKSLVEEIAQGPSKGSVGQRQK